MIGTGSGDATWFAERSPGSLAWGIDPFTDWHQISKLAPPYWAAELQVQTMAIILGTEASGPR
ncbi:hypothetical protein BGW80DRAFT_1300698 [Lactifluus volemus]|nr:hypothetical protein BGW80DRAFT_1300698 [Lactifluus volemus]